MKEFLRKCCYTLEHNPYSLYMMYAALTLSAVDESVCAESIPISVVIGVLEEAILRVLWFDMWNQESTASVLIGAILNCIGRRDPKVFMWGFLTGIGRRHNSVFQVLLARGSWESLRRSLCSEPSIAENIGRYIHRFL
jgi:hypothetical protein